MRLYTYNAGLPFFIHRCRWVLISRTLCVTHLLVAPCLVSVPHTEHLCRVCCSFAARYASHLLQARSLFPYYHARALVPRSAFTLSRRSTLLPTAPTPTAPHYRRTLIHVCHFRAAATGAVHYALLVRDASFSPATGLCLHVLPLLLPARIPCALRSFWQFFTTVTFIHLTPVYRLPRLHSIFVTSSTLHSPALPFVLPRCVCCVLCSHVYIVLLPHPPTPHGSRRLVAFCLPFCFRLPWLV